MRKGGALRWKERQIQEKCGKVMEKKIMRREKKRGGGGGEGGAMEKKGMCKENGGEFYIHN